MKLRATEKAERQKFLQKMMQIASLVFDVTKKDKALGFVLCDMRPVTSAGRNIY